jgi:hypothetical protein
MRARPAEYRIPAELLAEGGLDLIELKIAGDPSDYRATQIRRYM